MDKNQPCLNNLAVQNMFLLLKSSALEHTVAKRISCEIIHHRKGSEETSRLSYILDETMPFLMDKSKSKKGASVSKEFALC